MEGAPETPPRHRPSLAVALELCPHNGGVATERTFATDEDGGGAALSVRLSIRPYAIIKSMSTIRCTRLKLADDPWPEVRLTLMTHLPAPPLTVLRGGRIFLRTPVSCCIARPNEGGDSYWLVDSTTTFKPMRQTTVMMSAEDGDEMSSVPVILRFGHDKEVLRDMRQLDEMVPEALRPAEAWVFQDLNVAAYVAAHLQPDVPVFAMCHICDQAADDTPLPQLPRLFRVDAA